MTIAGKKWILVELYSVLIEKKILINNLLSCFFRCSECYDHDNNSRKITTRQFLKSINTKIQDYTQADNNLYIEC